ncbi:pilus assembly protein [Sphingomonas gilva]|uniref:Pilus assembly protein n=1 Tax=Sphingomonas gilva TaxID=2305907 RepID=A0A396RLK4_9SPHN|nr:pilus assembly protein [Sphingomonas gilva]
MRTDKSAVALLEFAYGMPVFLLMMLSGSELANYVTTKMRISQVALHVADHASRMGTGSLLSAKTISETNINDVLTGAGLQAGELDLYEHGRVVLSNIEPASAPTGNGRVKVTWQRCRGLTSFPSDTYGKTGNDNLPGMGPPGRTVGVPAGSATHFVEVFYEYQPLIAGKFLMGDLGTIREIASMTVRERRDLTKIYNTENATKSTC